MQEVTTRSVSFPSTGSQDVLTAILRDGAQRLLAEAVEAEVRAWIESHAHVQDEAGRRQVVRNGYLPKRSILTGIGSVDVEQPRVLDRRGAEGESFSSKILPPYLRKTRSLEELIPWLYLKGVSTGDFSEALSALVGPDAHGLSASTITRLKEVWEGEFQEWNKRSLEGKQYVYLWADGVHFNIRLDEDRQCILVLMGATADGKKELIAVADGYRESEQSWKALLLDVQARGLVVDPKLATGVRLLESARPGLSDDPRSAVLGSQDGQRARQASQADSAGGERRAASDLDGRDETGRVRRVRPVPGDLRGEVPQGQRVSGQGSRRAVGVLRLPRRALEAPANDQPDREHVRHRAVEAQADQGERQPHRLPDDGLQAHAVRRQALAALERLPAPRRRHPRSSVHRRNQTPTSRRLKFLIHNFLQYLDR